MATVIKVENLSKVYKLGTVGSSNFKEDLSSWWYNVRGRSEEYYNKFSEEEQIWSLKNVSFDIEQGDILGIIGKNGAGKSTLLKILSRITAPTSGQVKIKGRMASLLEVGTGFHPELSGRENIYLNGAILGMTKKEITSKFDEIVDFSGIERFIDTPVKRYSSGMYVRLAFSVAAHLEPEILVIDEVLSVGDSEFQAKCLGKIKDVSGQGRTVLFVSHNTDAVQRLTKKVLLLKKGQLVAEGPTDIVLREYLERPEVKSFIEFDDMESALGNEFIKIKSVKLLNTEYGQIKIDQDLEFEIAFWNISDFEDLVVAFDLYHYTGTLIFGTGDYFKAQKNSLHTVKCKIPANFLNSEGYNINLMFYTDKFRPLFNQQEIISFTITDGERDHNYTGKINGLIRTKFKWETV